MAEQDEVIAFLSDGASYGRPGSVVKRVDTHISSVFLVEDRVFKLKRAVQFPYLDYSTIALREACCRRELALNRRTAPDLYLAVRSLTRGADCGLAFDGPGVAVDWVLEMKRFDDGALFDEMAQAGQLTPALMRDLSDAIAAFHQTVDIVTDQDESAAIKATIEGNDENLRRFSPPLDRASVAALRAASLTRLSTLAPLLDARRHAGKVRRCHGDLHLRNVCLFKGRPTLFDCIEFSDALACTDTLYDVAFLWMDMVHRGLDDLANVAFNRYLDITEDIGGLPALPLFMSMRAAVRAHVLAAQSGQQRSASAIEEAQRYLALAASLLQPEPKRLIAIGGLSGSGKSTLAQALAGSFRPAPGARVIRSDVLRKRRAAVTPETRLPPSAYTVEASAEVYRDIDDHATATLAAGYTAIADAVFLQPGERNAIAAVAQRAGVAFFGFWLEAPAALLESRIGARQNDASDADRSVLARQMTLETGPIAWRRVDGSRDHREICAEIRQLVAATTR